jgi:hypothetical protein
MSEQRASWHEENQRGLVTEVARVRALLEAHAQGDLGAAAVDEACAAPALDALCRSFELSPFERDVVVMCAAMELDGSFAQACAGAHGDAARTYPTFGLALAALPGAHWSALTPGSPLRAWRLVELVPGELLTSAWLRIDEAILHFLAGTFMLDERVEPFVEPIAYPGELPRSQDLVAARLTELWSRPPNGDVPLVHLAGRDTTGRRAVAAAAAARCGLSLCAFRAADVPPSAAERDGLARIWMRQAMLGRSALLVEIDEADGAETERLALALAERIGSPMVVAGREPPRVSRPLVRLEVSTPTAGEQEELWRSALGADLNGAVERVVGQFDLARHQIEAAQIEARARRAEGSPAADAVWDASRAQARPRLDDLAQRIELAAAWDDLVVPETERGTLRELVLHVRHRLLVQERWGFAHKSRRGLGVSALFIGPSGTGKTMAAEVLARELRLDLYRIDLSAVVSKYIGETEKNLRRVFDAAEQGGAILLFDEADALFGKRSEVKDSHDRYANIEVGYLLQRMEAYRGLAILTTNMKSALDPAFLRRIRFVVQFTRPDVAARREIWQRVFPERTPTNGLDVDALARLEVTGGAIRNIALRAAFLAADAGAPVGMAQLADAARSECAKLERPVAEAEIGGWA